MANGSGLKCHVCGFTEFDDGYDGCFYCQQCCSQADEIRDTAIDNDEMLFLTKENVGSIVQRRIAVVKAELLSQVQTCSQFWETLRTEQDDAEADDGVGPTEPSDFVTGPRTLSYEDYYSEIRLRYVMGVQIMIELQIKALVEKFNVSLVIVGMVEAIWLRFVASTKLFEDDWADAVVNESESQMQGEADVFEPRVKHIAEPHNILGKRSVMIWYQSLSKTIPLSYSLVISFLVCHLAREPILSTDIVKWALEGKLPYFAAFVEIEKQIGSPSNACPLSSSRMFRPIQVVPMQKLESLAALIAHSIGLELPPVNFYAIASCYLSQLSLPIGTILPYAHRIYEWSMPPELWLSANESRLPTRACVMSILVVSIRILCNIHGFGNWEKALSCEVELSSSDDKIEGEESTSTSNMDDHDTDQRKRRKSKHNFDVRNTAKLATPSNDIYDSTELCSSQSDVWQDELDSQGGRKLRPGTQRVNDDAKQYSHLHDTDDSTAEPCNNRSESQQTDLNAAEILPGLVSKYNELVDTSEHSKDLQRYLQYCKEVVFAGVELSLEDHEEEQIIEDLWGFYQKEDNQTSNPYLAGSSPHKRPRGGSKSKAKESKNSRGKRSISNSLHSCRSESHKEKAIRRMKSNMEENRFCYMPPRVKVKRSGYLITQGKSMEVHMLMLLMQTITSYSVLVQG